jgi:hypothetical protein
VLFGKSNNSPDINSRYSELYLCVADNILVFKIVYMLSEALNALQLSFQQAVTNEKAVRHIAVFGFKRKDILKL